MKRSTQTIRLAALVAASALALSACGGSSGGSDGTSASSTPKGDGVLTVGTLLPSTGDLAFLGPPEFAGVDLAVKDINAAGGVNGKPVVQSKADSGDGTPKIAPGSVDKLLAAKADVIIGAASSSVSLSVIDKIVGAGVVEFSPANTSTAFDTYDDKGLYFRTAPSDVLQGAVLGNLVLQDGAKNVAILARQEAYGEALAAQAEKTIKDQGGTVGAKVLYSVDATSYTSEIQKIKDSKPDAIIVIAFNETTKIIPGLIAAGVGPQDVKTYFVDGNTADYSKDFPKGTLTGVKATYPGAELKSDFKARLLTVNSKLKDFTYGPESYDATIMSALAATAAKSDSGKAIASELQKISAGGTKCTDYAACVTLLKAGKDIDYDGVSGPVDLNSTGSPSKATIGIFQYGADNTYKNLEYVTGVVE
ncbi:MAG: amino acid transporter substrate-binding protein [Aeromicrobium sp.]|nr:amino acid transporter substrate-binding protein [Aeromicrobium sp.]